MNGVDGETSAGELPTGEHRPRRPIDAKASDGLAADVCAVALR